MTLLETSEGVMQSSGLEKRGWGVTAHDNNMQLYYETFL